MRLGSDGEQGSLVQGQAVQPARGGQFRTVHLSRQFRRKALKKDIWVDSKCLGESAPDIFFYDEVKGDQEHNISTESEFSPNILAIKTATGQNYFIRQYIKLGVFVGGANLELVNEEEGKKAISSLALAQKGTCSNH